MGRYKKLKPMDRLLKRYLRTLKEVGFNNGQLIELSKMDIPEPMERYRARLRVEKLLGQLDKVEQDRELEQSIDKVYFMRKTKQ